MASLGIILMDLLRHQLIFGGEGLPLGLLASKHQFTELQYLVSPEFRFGVTGFAQRRKRVLFGVLIVASSLISLFAGPSAALLLLPTQRSDWPAGGASAWLSGDDELLWPSALTASSVGGANCNNPDMNAISSVNLNTSACIWAGQSSLAEAFRQRHFDNEIDLVVDDGVLRRAFVIRSKGEVAETWVLGIHMAVGVLSKNVASAWYEALKWLPASNWHHTLRYRIFNETTISAQSWAPAVRSRCGMYSWGSSNSSGLLLQVCFQCLKLLSLSDFNADLGQYPELPEYGVRLDRAYWIPTNLSRSSAIDTQWLLVPDNATLNDNSVTDDLPSAFIAVYVPDSESNHTGTTFTCSVDARWAESVYTGRPVGDIDADYVQAATVQSNRDFGQLIGYQYNFLPANDNTWRRVKVDLDWLNTLTPSINDSTSGWTSLASLLTDVGMDNSTGIIINWIDVTSTLEGIIATLVADGMSRQGYSENGGSSRHFSDALNILPHDASASAMQRLLAGTRVFPTPAGRATIMKFSVVVGGYAYRADSLAYYLALTVLFLHAALALCHVAYLLWTRICCNAWDSIIGLIVLAATSGVPINSPSADDVFKNAATGVERYRTMNTKLRVKKSSAPALGAAVQTDVKIFFGDEKLAVGHQNLEIGKAYG